jgi:hypothetical protein
MANMGARESGTCWTEDEARGVLRACAESGLSMRAFAIGEGLHPRRLYWWMRRLGLETLAEAAVAPSRPRREASSSRLLPVIIKGASIAEKASVVIRGAGGTTMEIEASAVSPAWAAAVMIELERVACS